MKTYFRYATNALIGFLLFGGLSLLGWGLGDLPAYFFNPARTGYLLVTFLLQLAVLPWIPESRLGRGAGKTTVKSQKWAIPLLQVLSLAVVIVPPACDRRGIWVLGLGDWARFTGLGIHALGFLLMNKAQADLGKQFSFQVTLQEGHQLVTGGVFRYIRHPRYLGILLFNLGISLAFRSWIGLFLTGVTKLVLLWRIRDEETLLHGEFGPEWDAYSKRSWRLVPFVY